MFLEALRRPDDPGVAIGSLPEPNIFCRRG
jgi:hypothetical protein